jgi:hypothetical protein
VCVHVYVREKERERERERKGNMIQFRNNIKITLEYCDVKNDSVYQLDFYGTVTRFSFDKFV